MSCLLWLPAAWSVAIIVFAERVHVAQLADKIPTCCSQNSWWPLLAVQLRPRQNIDLNTGGETAAVA